MQQPIEGLGENFKFLVLEVSNQLSSTREFLDAPSHDLYDKIVSRDDYIDNLKNIIENKCFSTIHREKDLSKHAINQIRSAQIIGVNLERIADFCVNIVRQVGYFRDQAFLKRFEYGEMFKQIQDCLDLIQPAREKADLAGALTICRAEFELDRMYKTNFDHIMAELRTGLHVEDLITALFIIRYLERIGDSLLNIGEALIFAIIGEKIKIEQFQALQQTLHKSGIDAPLSEIDFQSIWGTRSGCRISRVAQKDRPVMGADQEGLVRELGCRVSLHGNTDKPIDPALGSIFKEGNLKKIRREKENIESWASIYPGLGPKIFSYHEEEENASMLVEFLPGCTLDEVLLTAGEDVVDNAWFVLRETLSEIWRSTRVQAPAPSEFMRQLRSRLDSVFQVHPAFHRENLSIGAARIQSTEDLMLSCQELEKQLAAPYTVFIHGDFNLNNVVYNHASQRIHFIDLYRSGRADPLTDVSVFLVSNFRVPVFEQEIRSRLNHMISLMFGFAEEFARESGDTTFEARLCLALARSFYTSTRFEMSHDFAEEMFLRAVYLMEKFQRHAGRPWEEFQLPRDVLYY